ncbi:5-oxoprolinase subunit PxpB [Cytobacillus sp. FJAT-54145]|uniref:5-oxoprolinase subunit PxpB n=1 Tax=Cytobacillus spartinae TaxID=3299023 RepID=A0ABW6K8C7_9BACI
MISLNYRISPLGDRAIIIQFGEEITKEANYFVHDAAKRIQLNPFQGYIELVPAFHTLTVHYDPVLVQSNMPYLYVIQEIKKRLEGKIDNLKRNGKMVKIPVCYEHEFAPDIDIVAKHNGLTKKEVIHLHTKNIYDVYFLGFSPGFPFLGGMDKNLSTPRKDSPRLKIPAGSVGIAGMQTGIYPIETPGGWQIIGRTPVTLFDAKLSPPSRIVAGDQVQFFEITKNDFKGWEDTLWE